MPSIQRIWLTRPREDSANFAAKLAENGIVSLVAPVMHIVPQPLAALPDKPHAILLTSRHATHALASLPTAWRVLPIYCVGNSTAHTAKEHGCTHIIPGTSDVLTLLPHIAADLGSGGQLLYFAGEDTRVDVVHLLGVHGVHVTSTPVYRAVAEHNLSDVIRQALTTGDITGVAFFSPRSAQIACELMQAAHLAKVAQTIDAFCFSLNVAAAAGKLGWKNIHACHTPNQHAMCELIVSHELKTL